MTLFQNGTKETTIKARGNAISKAVDAAQIVTNRFVPEARMTKVTIGTEEVKDEETGATSQVSWIEIRLSMQGS